MPITAGAASAKINELKSKLAIYRALKDTIHSNYLSADGGAPELRLSRADGTSVSQDHFESVLEELDEKFEEATGELTEWESMVFEPAKPAGASVRPITAPPALEPKRSPERKAHGRRFPAATPAK